jgi:hygromycin-B 7''-O-kinase
MCQQFDRDARVVALRSGRVYVKSYPDESRWKQAKEVHVYGLLAAHGVGPIPEVVQVDTERANTTLTLLPGRPLSEASPSVMRTAYRQVGALLARLHRITMPAFGYLVTELVDPRPDNTTYMTDRFATKLAEFDSLGGDPELYAAVRARVAERAGLFASCGRPVLCHNDLHEGNVLVDEAGTVTGLIDVENAIAADPVMDLAKTLQYDLHRSPVKRAGLLDGYGPLPADGLARVELYRLYHALELWDWFALIGNTDPLPGIAEDIRQLATS